LLRSFDTFYQKTGSRARYISFAVLLAIIIVIGALFYKVMIGFFVPVFLAAVLVVVFRPLHRWVCAKVGDREHLAAGATTTLIVLIVLIPAGLVLTMAAIQGANVYRNFDSSSIKLGLAKLRSNRFLNLDFPLAKQVQNIQEKVSDIQLQVAKQQPYQDLISEKGLLRSDIAELNAMLDQLIPGLIESSRLALADKLAPMRGKSDAKTAISHQFDSELSAFFGDLSEDLTRQIAMQDSELKGPDELHQDQTTANRLAKPEKPLESLSQSENAIALDAKLAAMTKGLEWSKSIEDMRKQLKACSPSEEPTIAELQRAVVGLVTQWQLTRETIAGGPWSAFIKDIANPSDEEVEKTYRSFFAYIQPRLVTFTGDSAAFLLKFMISSSILLVSLYFFLYDGPSMVRTLMELSPLDDRYELELLAQFDRISRAIVLATVLSALLQGLVAGIGYYFAGMPSLILLTALTATCALVPFVGPAIVWVPVCFYLAFYQENLLAAGLLALWGMLVVGTVDNLVKVFVLHGQSQLHPLLALLSVLGGIQSLGPIGILVGPMVVVLLQTLLGILRTELTHFKKTEEMVMESGVPTNETKTLSGLIRKVKSPSTSQDSGTSIPETAKD
jgi:predicted PurR-regulated permease PerM